MAKHHAAITDPIGFEKLLRSINAYSGQPVRKLALRFTPHVYLRPGEVRKAEWSEIEFEKALWTIPADRMKQRQPHRVPLSRQALAILRETWSADAIERALSPADGNQIRAAYHRGAHWPERVEMAQWWSDHLDTLKEGLRSWLSRGRRLQNPSAECPELMSAFDPIRTSARVHANWNIRSTTCGVAANPAE